MFDDILGPRKSNQEQDLWSNVDDSCDSCESTCENSSCSSTEPVNNDKDDTWPKRNYTHTKI